ncbi:prostacyclin synthase [Colletotrichum sojae]|uniref:Prostacyclin synthase n=1 Tax=Colletotrichum sojae TaxID=2175907 RepID=A0A8H6ISM5_9PEZI|nr:prostacyclin synthase [Colletotrichum sojae]
MSTTNASGFAATAAAALLQRVTSGSSISLAATALAIVFALLIVIDKLISAPIDPREPLVLKGSLPIIGHLIGVKTQYPGVYENLARNAKLPICTLPLLNKKMYLINTAPLVQSAMRNKTLEFGARIEEIGQAMGVDPAITKRLVRENAVEEISRITVAALSGDNLYDLNIAALRYIGSRFNEIEAGTSFEIGDLYHWTRDLIGVATTRALYGEQSPFNNTELVDSIWIYETGLGKLQYGWFSKIIAGKALQARKKIVGGLVGFYTRKLDEGDSVSAVIKGRGAFWRSFGLSDVTLGAMDSLPVAATVNTAPSMFWLLVNIFSRPKYLTRLRNEVENASVISITEEGGRRVVSVDVTALGTACPYLVACYRETLRFENTVTGSRTVMARDTTITDHETGHEYLLKEGVEVQWSAAVMHKQPVWGEDRDVFNPERWLRSTHEISKGSKESFVPFGGGKHLCPGRNFATSELLGCLAVLAVGFEIEEVQVPGHAMLFEHSGLRSPIYGRKSKKATLKRRQGWEDVEWRYK